MSRAKLLATQHILTCALLQETSIACVTDRQRPSERTQAAGANHVCSAPEAGILRGGAHVRQEQKADILSECRRCEVCTSPGPPCIFATYPLLLAAAPSQQCSHSPDLRDLRAVKFQF
jgi:hypothetical protein